MSAKSILVLDRAELLNIEKLADELRVSGSDVGELVLSGTKIFRRVKLRSETVILKSLAPFVEKMSSDEPADVRKRGVPFENR